MIIGSSVIYEDNYAVILGAVNIGEDMSDKIVIKYPERI